MVINIGKQQAEQYLQQDSEQFLISIIEILNENIPELIEDIPKDDLSDMVENGIVRSRHYGFESDEDIAAFVSVMFEISPNFDEQQEINNVLNNTTILIENRFDAVFDQVSTSAWSEAELNYDSKAWLIAPPSKTKPVG